MQQIDPVGIIVAGDELPPALAQHVVEAGLEEQVHRPPGHRVTGVQAPVTISAPGVVEV